MRHLLISLISLAISLYMNAQNAAPVSGEYYLEGVRETASGFRFHPDSSFEFFFSYGALDRYGKGKFSIKNDKLVLNSNQQHAKAFALLNTKKETGGKTTIRVAEQNKHLLQYVFVKINDGLSVKEGSLDEEGVFVYEGTGADTIQLMFEFCPDKPAAFTGLAKDDNFFEFTFDPSIMEYYFNNFTLEILKDELKGAHPLLNGNEFRYIKNEGE